MWSVKVTRGKQELHSQQKEAIRGQGEVHSQKEEVHQLEYLLPHFWPGADNYTGRCNGEQPGCSQRSHRCWEEEDWHNNWSKEAGMGRESSTEWVEGRTENE